MSTLLLVAGVFVLAGAVQALSGFGAALVAVPLLAMVLGPAEAVVLSVLVGLVQSSYAAVREREHVERRTAVSLLGWALPALPLGLVVLQVASEATVSLLVGAVVVVAALLLGAGARLPEGRLSLGVAGAASGVLLTSTGLNGPPLVIAMAGRRDASPRAVRATLQAVFAVQDVVALAGFAVLGLLSVDLVPAAVAGVVGIQLGWLLGGLGFRRLSRRGFERVVRAVLLATGLSATVAALR
ncbi:MAG: TSUP family transporter [Nocardioides sp.]|uniref:TSUP family transporter n=1 Tax=Nocardioides sp. TaxID=35761 RepID=UPI003F0AD277